MKSLFLLTIILLNSVFAFAIPAQRRMFEGMMKDGTKVRLLMVGDECFHYFINVENEEKMKRGEDGYFYVMDDDDFAEREASANERRKSANRQRSQRLMKNKAAWGTSGRRRIGAMNNGIEGEKKGLIILVNFSDKQFDEEHDSKVFADMFNKNGYDENGHIGSVHDYFYDQSYGKFSLSFDVVGPVTLSNNMAYYGGNDSRDNDRRPAQMAKEACQLAHEQGVNFADYDWDGDNVVEQVYLIYAGYGENYSGSDPNTIWPHEWSLSGSKIGKLVLDGTTIDTYACSAELTGTSGNTLTGIGTACHEFSHCLGYPDFYDTDYSGGIGMEAYDIMDGGNYNGPNHNGEVPVGFTAYERAMAGWLTPIELNESMNVINMPDLNDEPIAYIIYNEGHKDEFLMLENRQAKRWFEYYSYGKSGHGLFITHIDENASVWENNTPNDDPTHQRMTWVAADNSYGKYNSADKRWSLNSKEVTGDFFPGTLSITSMTNSSHLNVGGKMFNTNTDGSYFINHELTDISEDTNSGTVSFNFDNSTYTITFDGCGGKCETEKWTQSTFREAAELPTPQSEDDEWTFAGWSTTPLIEESSSTPTFVEENNGYYSPTEDVTLFAVYKKTTGNSSGEGGFKLKMEKNKETIYIGEMNASGNGFETSTDNGTVFYFRDGKLSFDYNGNTTYVIPKINTSSPQDLEFSREKPSKAIWTLSTTEEGVTFEAIQKDPTTLRYLGVNGNSVKAYASRYQHVWTRCDETTYTYTSYPTVNISTLTHIIDKLQETNNGYSLNDVQKVSERILMNSKTDN